MFVGRGKWVDTDIYGSTLYELGEDYDCSGILGMSVDDEFKYDNGFIKDVELTRLYPCLHNPECHFKRLERIFKNGECIYHPAFYNEDDIAITHAGYPTFLIRKILHIKIKERSENPSEISTEEPSSAPDIKKEKPSCRRNKQINSILKIAKQLKYVDLMAIPEGGKAAIKIECLKITALFTPDGFKRAWQEANRRELISMQNKDKYY